tara:strand:- start:173 stop:472 length:300 start_codon:yes stop_codon:yes gene_type:complete
MKLRKKKPKKVGIQRKMASFYADYYGTLKADEAIDEDLHSAKVVIEGSMEVGWRLLKEARENKNYALERSIRENFQAAQKRIRIFIELLETEQEGRTIG